LTFYVLRFTFYVSRFTFYVLRSAFQRAGQDAADEVAPQQQEEKHGYGRRDERGGHLQVVQHQRRAFGFGHDHLHRLRLARGQRQRQEELIPYLREDDDRYRRVSRQRDGH